VSITRWILRAVQDSDRSYSRTARGDCPFCIRSGHMTKKKNLVLDRVTGRWYCWRCSKGGVLPGFKPDEDAANFAKHDPEIRAFDPPPGWQEISTGNDAEARKALAYALKRGIKALPIAEAHLGVSLDAPVEKDGQDFRRRLIIPLRDSEGTWVGYVGRDYTGRSTLPYMYVKGMQRKLILYNRQALDVETERPVFVVEGTLDALAVWPDAVAVLGTWSAEHADYLLESKRPVVALLDGDAWRKGEALAMVLELHGVRAGFIRLPPKLDPDEVPRDWIDEEAKRCLRG